MTTRYLDFDNGNDSNDGSTFALRKKTLNSATTGLGGGDTVRIIASPDATSMGQNATFTNGSPTVTLTTAVTANIDTCEAAWTASANVTATAQSGTSREGTNAASLSIASGFTTGLVAYHAMSATDFSGYKQISLLVRTNAGLAASVLSLNLCSDAAGATPVNTIAIPAITAGNWTAVVVDTGAALGSSIQSVSISAASDPGTITVYLDNILACKDSTSADSLTHLSYIGKGTDENTEPWMPIECINGTSIRLWGNHAGSIARSDSLVTPNYQGSTATQTIYKREPTMVAAQTIAVSGTSLDSKLTIEGGYNRTDMSTKTGRSYLRARDPSTLVSSSSSKHDINLVSIGFHSGGNYCHQFFQGGGHTCSDVCINGGAYGINGHQGSGMQLSIRYSVMVYAYTFYLTGSWDMASGPSSFKSDFIWGTGNSVTSNSHAVYDTTSNVVLAGTFDCAVCKHVCRGLYAGAGVNRWTIRNTTFSDTYADFSVSTDLYMYNVTCSVEATFGGGSITYGVLRATKYMGDVAKNWVVWGALGMAIGTASDQRHTASDVSWKFTTTASIYAWAPKALSIAKVACVANEQRTVTAWFRRDHATNISMRLAARGGFVAGIANDVVANMTAAANTWEQVTLQFTPTENCVVEVFAECYGALSGYNAWVDDLGVS